jgi:Protein of unknown function DUF262
MASEAEAQEREDEAAQIASEYDPVEAELYEDDAEDAQTLDSDDDPALVLFDKQQRDLVTSVVDYNLGTLSDLVSRQKIDLSPKYQRRFRWDRRRQSKLIESFMMNVPVPPIFLNEDRYGTYAVIDGKQRLFAIREFLRGRLKLQGLQVFDDINGQSIDDLPSRLRDILETRATLRAVIILPQSQPAVKYEVFKRLNTGGVRLNPQEIRNSSWPGPLNNMILELSELKEFHALLSITDPAKSALYREMRDAEFVLRYLTFRDTWDSFRGGMMRRMDDFMSENQHMGSKQLDSARRDFRATLEAVEAGFGEHAFQRWVPSRRLWRRQVLASLYDAEMFASRGRDPERLRARRDAIEAGLKRLFSNDEFRSAIDAATNTPRLFQTRTAMMREMVDSAIAD